MKNKKNQRKITKFISYVLIIISIFLYSFTGCKIIADTYNNITDNDHPAFKDSESSQTLESNPQPLTSIDTTYAVSDSDSGTEYESTKQESETNGNNTLETTAAEDKTSSQDLADNMETISKNPVTLSSFEIKGVPCNFLIKDNLAYITWGYIDPKANSYGGLTITDIADKKNPLSSADMDLKGLPFDMIIDKNICYILWGKEDSNDKQKGGLSIIDISNKNKPESLGGLNFENMPVKMLLNEDYIYIFYQTHLSVIDVRNKEMPKVISSYNINNSLKHVFMTQDYQYLVTEIITQNKNGEKTVKSSLEIIGIYNKINPVSIGKLELGCTVYDIFIEKDFGFILGEDGLKIINIINKNTPVLTGTINMLGNYLKIKDDTAFIGSAFGINTVDLSNKETPLKKSFYPTEHLVSGMEVFGKYLYSIWVERDNSTSTASARSGVEIFDTYSKDKTNVIDNLFIENYILNIYKEQNYLFIIWGRMEKDYNRSGGITVVKLY